MGKTPNHLTFILPNDITFRALSNLEQLFVNAIR
jgi:hypothetical protein